MSASPLWFGPAGRSLFGWLHLPDDGRARGGVVLCLPLGIEAICAHYTYRALAERLAGAGIAVVRFDYDGTGDSVGDQADPARVASWLGSVQVAVDLLLETGVDHVGLVGMRMGALFAAAEAARRGGVDSLVLWDPCANGRSFLREQRALRLVSIGGEDPGDAVDAPGLRFSADTVGELRGLDLGAFVGRLAHRTLVLQAIERPGLRRLIAKLDKDTEWVDVLGQQELLDPQRQEPPAATLEGLVGWLSGVMGPSRRAVERLEHHSTVVVAAPAGGAEVIERPVAIGAAGLFGMISEPSGGAAGPSIVFVNEGNTPHIGQSRLWVELAREWSAAGLRTLRFDLSGNGDSGVRPGQSPHVARAPEAYEDVLDAIAEVTPESGGEVVLVGLCSGAYQAMEVALATSPRGVCVINPALSFIPPDVPGGDRPEIRRARQGTKRWVVALARQPVRLVGGRRAGDSAGRWPDALEAGYWPSSLASRRPWIPQLVWRAANRLLLDNPAARTLESLVGEGVETFLICGPSDLAPLFLGARRVLPRLERSPDFSLRVLEGLDHAGLIVEQRQLLKEAITGHVLTRYAPTRADGSPRIATDRR